jgi:hypothetical protein
MTSSIRYVAGALALAYLAVALPGCTTTPVVDCTGPQSRSLDDAFAYVEDRLASGCEYQFDAYLADLLSIAEGDPRPENKRKFSEFLVAAGDSGLLSNRQARDIYNRYFNVKFVSLQGDYNNCTHTCPRMDNVLDNMENELLHKELGLLRVSEDAQGYYRADRLFKEAELVLEATCLACSAAQP